MGKKNKVKIGTCKQCGKENIELYNGLCEKHYIEKQKRRKRNIVLHDKEYVDTNDSKVHDNQNKYIPPENYGFTFEQIENRVLADCNIKRLKEHRQCDYCHMIFDCKYYNYYNKKTLCEFLDNTLNNN